MHSDGKTKKCGKTNFEALKLSCLHCGEEFDGCFGPGKKTGKLVHKTPLSQKKSWGQKPGKNKVKSLKNLHIQLVFLPIFFASHRGTIIPVSHKGSTVREGSRIPATMF